MEDRGLKIYTRKRSDIFANRNAGIARRKKGRADRPLPF
jgi:hypothetical protein